MSLDTMKKRLIHAGGDMDGRIVKGKLKSMQAALKSSYQAEWITLNEDDEEKKAVWRCLINPDKLKEDYDQKEISIEFESGLQEGDTFLWNRTDTHWIVYLQEYSEEAYFRASIRRCDYQIEVDNKRYWIYMRGPMETTIPWRTKHNISFNELNYNIVMYIPKNESTYSFFERHKTIKFDGYNWKVEAVDRYSQKNIIEVVLVESFNNEMEDAAVVPEIIKPDEATPHIEGPQFVEAFGTEISYEIKNANNGTFVVNSSKVNIDKSDENTCILSILTGKQHNFDLIYRRDGENDIVLNITVESF